MAEKRIFDNYGTTTKQTLVAYNANSLAPYTLLECICDIPEKGSEDDFRGMELIYSKINTSIAEGMNTGSISSLSNNQYLLVWDNTASSQNTPKFKVLNLGDSGSGSGSGNSGTATSVFGNGGKFYDRVKYAESLYSTSNTAAGVYIPYLTISSNSDQNTSYVLPPDDSDSTSTKALVLKGNTLGWGSAGAILNPAPDSNPYYLIGKDQNVAAGSAPDTLYYDSRIYFKGGSLYHASDETLKTFTSDVDINLDNLATIKKGMFYWNSDPDKISHLGVTAQSVEALYPEIVSSNEGHLSVDYAKLSVVALAAIDKLNERIKELEKQIEDLKK